MTGLASRSPGLLVFAAAWFCSVAQARPLVSDLAEHTISITSSFSGTDLLLFGAISGGPGDIVVVVRGPMLPVVVRRKDQVAGIWVNGAGRSFTEVPGYYAAAASRPLWEIDDALRAEYAIGLENLRFSATDPLSEAEILLTRQAIVRAKLREGLYRAEVAEIRFLGDQLFRTRITFPANVPVGTYSVNVLLLREGKIIDQQLTPLEIQKFGVERTIFDFAQNQPLLYGLAAVALAVGAGWLAGAIFSRP